MKTGLLKLITLLGYLGLILIVTGLQWERFLDVRILLLVVAGTFCLSVPELIKKRHMFRSGLPSDALLLAGILEKQPISAGLLLSFLLLFSDNIQAGGSPGGIYQATLCFRPLFYGYCIHILLHVEEIPENGWMGERNEVNTDAEAPVEDEAARLRELGLTKREMEIARYLLRGHSNGEIAGELAISEATVKKHVSNIFQKLGIGRREQMAGLLDQKDGQRPPRKIK